MGLLDNKLTPVERVKVINAVRGKLPIDYSTEMTIIPVEFEEQSSRIPVIIPEREAVNSFFADYYGARGTCRIIYKTTAEWDSDPELIARRSVIYVYLDADQVSLAIGKGGTNIKLASMLTEYTIDVFRVVNENEADEDIYLDEFSDEVDQWVIDAIKAIGLDTAKAVLNAPREMLIEKADLEEETVDHLLSVLRAEFE